MPRLLPVVEGDGEVAAVPALLYRLFEEAGHVGWFVDDKRVMKVGSLASFHRRLDDYLSYLRIEAPDAVLLLFDLDDGCPCLEARSLAEQVRGAQLPFPIAVVLAHREYEAWFLASMEHICLRVPVLPDELHYDGDPEALRDAKGWISAQMEPGKAYKPTTDQKRFTSLLDLGTVRGRSRSFRRLCDAVGELVQHAGQPLVTPQENK